MRQFFNKWMLGIILATAIGSLVEIASTLKKEKFSPKSYIVFSVICGIYAFTRKDYE